MSKEFSEFVPMLDAFSALSYSEQNDVLLGKRSLVIPKPESEQVKDTYNDMWLGVIPQSKPEVEYTFPHVPDPMLDPRWQPLFSGKEMENDIKNIIENQIARDKNKPTEPEPVTNCHALEKEVK